MNASAGSALPSKDQAVPPATRRMWLLGGAIALAALALRVAWALPPRSVRWDEADLLLLASNLVKGAGYTIFGAPETTWPPGAPLLAALGLLLGVPVDRALTLWHVLAGAAACALLFGLASDVAGDWRVGALAGLLAAVLPALAVMPLYWGSDSEMVFLAFILAGLWASWRLLRGARWPAGAAGGLAFGAAYLVRPEGMIYWLVILVLALIVTLRRRSGWSGLAAFVLAFLAAALPYMLYLRQVSGFWLLSGKSSLTVTLGAAITDLGSALGNDVATVLDSSGREILWLSPERFKASYLDVVRADPALASRRLAGNGLAVFQTMLDPLLGPVLLALAALGLFGRPWSRERALQETFWLATLLPLMVVPFFHVQARLLTPMVPAFLVWASRGVLAVAGWAHETAAPWPRLRPLVNAALMAGLAALLLGGVWQQCSASLAGQASLFPSHQQIGTWLAAASQPGEPIMTRNSEIALYAGRPLVALPNASWQEIVAYGAAHGARYLALDDWEVETLRPQLAPLLRPDSTPPELSLMTTVSDPRRTTYLFRFNR